MPNWELRKRNKFNAQKTIFNGRKYDSKGEAGLASDIELLRKAGEVIKVEPQRTFELYGKNGSKICTHRPDFLLTFKDSHKEVWEYKGFATENWRLKRNLFVDNYPDILYVVYTANNSQIYKYKKYIKQ